VMCGATGPVTTAGALVVANAEILSGLVIHQLKAKGAPFIYGGGTPPLNMVTTVCSYGDPQGIVGAVSLVQLAQFYNLPSFSIAGCTDAQLFDQQAAMEAGFNLLMSALAGGNLIHDLGYIGVGLTFSLEYLVLCNEGVGAAKFMTRGVEVNPRTLALDVIEKVGPGGHFLTEQHTLDYFKHEMHFTKLFNRSAYDNWQATGSKTFGEHANNLLKEILQWHEVPGLDLQQEEEIKAIAEGKS
jgi:trimethylamine---corrinoid protein Co-methyltransferase